ncbi:MAG TPA: hypothetical protein VMR45_03945 [Patescibacteria group bacterium]|nr:hypothetical protein [Patescibacteria group bacterium]
MELLVHKLQAAYPQFSFIVGKTPCWSPRINKICYAPDQPNSISSLLHELAHATLQHKKYANDIDLLRKEVDAWDEAQKLAAQYGLALDDNHIQNCIDTYRDWLHKRSICPACNNSGIQESDPNSYRCINCSQSWQVSNSRFCRPYRITPKNKKAS